jgi:hypothetical protein
VGIDYLLIDLIDLPNLGWMNHFFLEAITMRIRRQAEIKIIF